MPVLRSSLKEYQRTSEVTMGAHVVVVGSAIVESLFIGGENLWGRSLL